MGIIKYTGAFLMIALFTIALITFAVNFAGDNDASINIGDDSNYNELNTGMSEDIEEFYVSANTSDTAYQESTISSQTEATEGGTQFKVSARSSLSMAKRGVTSAWNSIFGQSSEFNIIFTAIFGFFGIMMGWYLYKAWAGRNPD